MFTIMLLLGSSAPIHPGPTPIGDASQWVTFDDYPGDTANGKDGISEVEIFIDTQGNGVRCRVISSSGTPALDQAACVALGRRGSWKPTLDDNGQPVFAVYHRRIVWSLPGSNLRPLPVPPDLEVDVAKLPVPREQALVTIRQIEGADGSNDGCIVASRSASPALDRLACQVAASLTKLDPIVDASGKAVRGARWRKIQFSEKDK